MKKHLMLDLETFSQLPTAAVISIGAVIFDKRGVHDTFKVNIKPESAKEFGMTISSSTVEWWMGQPKEVQEATLTRGVNADFGLNSFKTWCETHNPEKFWAHGVTFDYPIMDNAYRCVGLESPWKYWQIMDTRTLFGLFGIQTNDLHAKAGSSHHSALDDARVQAEAVVAILNSMGWSDEESPIKI